jgi:multiple sugar transport system permease protein
LLLVLLLHSRSSRFHSSFLSIYFAPGSIAGPTAVLLAIFMFDPNVSPFRFLLHALGYELVTDTIRLSNLPVIFALLTFFLGAGAWIAILYGALNNLSREVIEAAQVDGCNQWQLAWHIKLPLILPYIIYMLILVLVTNVQLFAEPQLINAATTSVNTRYWAPNQLAYAFAFESANFGAAAVVSIIMVIIGLLGTLLILSLTDIFRTE